MGSLPFLPAPWGLGSSLCFVVSRSVVGNVSVESRIFLGIRTAESSLHWACICGFACCYSAFSAVYLEQAQVAVIYEVEAAAMVLQAAVLISSLRASYGVSSSSGLGLLWEYFHQ